MAKKPDDSQVDLNLKVRPDIRDDLNDLARMCSCTPSQLVTAMIAFRKEAWLKAMSELAPRVAGAPCSFATIRKVDGPSFHE